MKKIEIGRIYHLDSFSDINNKSLRDAGIDTIDMYLLVDEDWELIRDLHRNRIIEQSDKPFYHVTFYSFYDNKLNVVASDLTTEEKLNDVVKTFEGNLVSLDQEAKLRLLIDVYNQDQYR